MHECWNCGEKAIEWESDSDLEDTGIEGFLFLQMYRCAKCGAWIEYYIPSGEANET